jgi:hypothetical protein
MAREPRQARPLRTSRVVVACRNKASVHRIFACGRGEIGQPQVTQSEDWYKGGKRRAAPRTPTLVHRAVRLTVKHDADVSSIPPVIPYGGFSPVRLRHHLIGPIRPTRRHIAISPHSGLYAMPSLCGSA